MTNVTEPVVAPQTHEEALKVFANWTHSLNQIEPNSIRTKSFNRILRDIKKMYGLLDALSAQHDKGANEYLKKTGSYSQFDEPSCVRMVREFVQEL